MSGAGPTQSLSCKTRSRANLSTYERIPNQRDSPMSETLSHVTADELKEQLEGDTPPVLINALPRPAHEAKHIPGSVNVPVDDIEMAEQLVPNKDEAIVVYCANADCDASPKAVRALEKMGYTNVSDFEDGYAGWRRAGYPLVGTDA